MITAFELNHDAFDTADTQSEAVDNYARISPDHSEGRNGYPWLQAMIESTLQFHLLVDESESSAAFTNGSFTEQYLKREKFGSYEERIRELSVYAAEDGYCLCRASNQDFWRFVQTDPRIRRGNLILMDNGKLRAAWKDGKGTHLGLQFLGGGMLQYVIFKKREAASVVSRVAGRDTFDGLKRQIDAFDLFPLLYQ